jgi:hypothetical protein
MAVDPIIKPGERLNLTGRSGSGKTYLGRWFMIRAPMNWVVLDSKHDPSFDKDNPIEGLAPASKLIKGWSKSPIVVVRPSSHENNPAILDNYLGFLHDAFDNFGVNIDEAYQCTNGPHPGPGLKGLLTRGRVRKQSVIVSSQTPSWIPKFCFSEANYFANMTLNLPEHRERIRQFIGDDRVLQKIPSREWWWYDVGGDELTRFGPVTINA